MNGNNNGKLRHKPDHQTNFATMKYDTSCPRCAKIRTVVFLLRKNMNNGCSREETSAALAKASSMIQQYGLLRGEYVDRQYNEQIRVVIHTQQTDYTVRRRGKMSSMHKRRTDYSILS